MNWQGPAPTGPTRCLAQIRAQHRAVAATVEPLAGDGAGDRVRVWFDVPQSAITPGQVVTLYQDDLVLGGGWIEHGLDRPRTAAPRSEDQPENARW